jgi:hypothetical protein
MIRFNGLFQHLSEVPPFGRRFLARFDSPHAEQGAVMAKQASPTRAKPPAVGNSVKKNLKIEIETLLDTISAQLPKAHRCENCGFEMINIDVLFFLANNQRSWNIPLSICTKCNREKYLKFITRQAT